VKDNYPIVIFWSDEDDAYIADVPDLRSCSAWGDTPEEALREVLVAREAWLEVARERGLPLPDPRASRYLPDVAQEATRVGVAAS
jgi:predicted RNase H-like HicB family nuclease